ncbi:hypothetical protein EWM64_g7236 [Hericium alpestre]|uniref:Uncharacterized protein n=1 Tax=Hericium alpestre TaxID=135208 RepID=A0A4Y9ZQA4_9AGAM|nr:hypothetical protein EWM64_g7236 [Hericium alpestre]
MEERGKIKTFQTAIRLPTGPQKHVRIMYLPTIAKEQLDTYVAELGRGLPTPQQPVVKRVEEEIKYGRELAEPNRRTLPLDLLQRARLADYQGNPTHPEAVDELFQREDQDIRDTLLTERSIVSQLHGFISGKALRARELHLYTLRSFEEQPNSFHIVSVEERIIHLSFYSNDIPLAVFCALVSTLTHDEQLTQLLLSEEGRRMLVKNLPLDLYSNLSVGRTRTRSRLLDLFELLQGIGVVTPLQLTESATPFLRCTPKNEHPSAFDVFTETWSPQSSINSPAYWRFNTEAPIHLWSISEDSPAFWKNMPIRTLEEAMAYWEDLCKVCIDREFAASITCPPTGMRPQGSLEATARSIRRKSSWKSSYDLSPIQQHYLNRFFNQSTGQTPLQDQDGGAATLERIAWVISAPLTVVTEWFRESHARYVHRIERAERKPRPKKAAKAEKAARRAAEEQQLVEKAANARAQREQDWQSLVQRLHPDPMDDMTAARIGRIRNLFMDSGTRADNKKWEREVSRALQDAKTAEETRLVTSQKKASTVVRPSSRPGVLSKAAPPSKGTALPARGPPPPVAAIAPGKSVAELIADQGPVRHQKKAKKRSKKAKEGKL